MILVRLLLISTVQFTQAKNLTLISQIRTGYLSSYLNYIDAVLLYFTIPSNSASASIRFRGSELSNSLYSCDPREVRIYLTHGSPPVINPDGSRFPENYYLTVKPEIYFTQLMSDKSYKFLNITHPKAGSYFAATFHPYVNPQDEPIKQAGLTASCNTFLEVNVYVEKNGSSPEVIRSNEQVNVELTTSKQKTAYMFSVPENCGELLILYQNIDMCNDCHALTTEVYDTNSPSEIAKFVFDDKNGTTKANYAVCVKANAMYHIDVHVKAPSNVTDPLAKFTMKLQIIPQPSPKQSNTLYNNVIYKEFCNKTSIRRLPYKEYELVKSASAESFLYTYEMQPFSDGSVPVTLNVSSEDFSVLTFKALDIIDVSGSLQFIVAFKPRVSRTNGYPERIKEPENHTVIACISLEQPSIPQWPNHCNFQGNLTLSPLQLNRTKLNTTVVIPYPSAGTWFLSLKLHCDKCVPCNCSTMCQNELKRCVEECRENCTGEACGVCEKDCDKLLRRKTECQQCDCDGSCRRSNATCDTKIIYDISSYPCAPNSCGANGNCGYMVSQGFTYSTCVCMNNYKGWDCSDADDANSLTMVVLELLLLVLSNVMFFPAAYVAYRNNHPVEAIVYCSAGISSSLYHACDAGENIASVCVTRSSVLQFADFYCALLSIWVTLIAIACLMAPLPAVFLAAGGILIAIGTTLDKTSLWVFVIPVAIASATIITNWAIHYKKTKALYPTKSYLMIFLPAGLVLALIGLLMFCFLETRRNYKYVHSSWHILMAIALILLFPTNKHFPKSQSIS